MDRLDRSIAVVSNSTLTGCLLVSLSRATARSSVLSSSSLTYTSYSSCRRGGTDSLWSATHARKILLVHRALLGNHGVWNSQEV